MRQSIAQTIAAAGIARGLPLHLHTDYSPRRGYASPTVAVAYPRLNDLLEAAVRAVADNRGTDSDALVEELRGARHERLGAGWVTY